MLIIMLVLLKIALRNLFAHKAKTIIVGTLIFIGIFFIIMGNSFIDSVEKGIANSYSKSVTGQIAVLKNIPFDYSLFGTWVDMGNLSVPKLPDFDDVEEYVKNHPNVENITTISSGFAIINTEQESEDAEWMITFGLDPESYTKMFDVTDTLTMHSGRFLKENEDGIVISEHIANQLEKEYQMIIKPGDSILLNGFSSNGFRVRRVTVRGIYSYNYVKDKTFPMIERTCFLDIQTFRILNGITVETADENDEALDQDISFTELSMDDLFCHV